MIEQRLRGVRQRGTTLLLGEAVDLAETDSDGKIELRRAAGFEQGNQLLEDQQPVEGRRGPIRRRLEQPEHPVARGDLTIQMLPGRAESMCRIDGELTSGI